MSDRILSNRYKLESELGRGGMGVVYRAQDTQVKRTVAIKTLPAIMTHNPDLMRRFQAEVQHASKLEHPNIVRVYDVGEDDGTHYYVMQYIEGSDLRAELKQRGRYTVEAALAVISQLAEALDYAHSQGIVHRDIKPENILLDAEGQAHIVDFGIAKAVEGTRMTRGLLGTPEYMSPEQVKGNRVDGRSDQYSLAVLAYELLTGRTPFPTQGDDPWAQINMHLNTPPPNPRTTVPDLPTPVANALLQALAKDPEQRFKNCGEFVQALRGEVKARVPMVGQIPTIHHVGLHKSVILGAVAVFFVSLALWQWWLHNSHGRRIQSTGLHNEKSITMLVYLSNDSQTQAIIAVDVHTNERRRIAYFKGDNYSISSDGSCLLTDTYSYAGKTQPYDGKAQLINLLDGRSRAIIVKDNGGEFRFGKNADRVFYETLISLGDSTARSELRMLDVKTGTISVLPQDSEEYTHNRDERVQTNDGSEIKLERSSDIRSKLQLVEQNGNIIDLLPNFLEQVDYITRSPISDLIAFEEVKGAVPNDKHFVKIFDVKKKQLKTIGIGRLPMWITVHQSCSERWASIIVPAVKNISDITVPEGYKMVKNITADLNADGTDETVCVFNPVAGGEPMISISRNGDTLYTINKQTSQEDDQTRTWEVRELRLLNMRNGSCPVILCTSLATTGSYGWTDTRAIQYSNGEFHQVLDSNDEITGYLKDDQDRATGLVREFFEIGNGSHAEPEWWIAELYKWNGQRFIKSSSAKEHRGPDQAMKGLGITRKSQNCVWLNVGY